MSLMRPAVQVDRPESMGPADIEDVDALQFRNLDNLHAVRRQEHSRATRWLAARVRFERIRPATGVQGPRPGLEGKIRFRWHSKRVRNEALSGSHTLLLRRAAERPAVRGACGPPTPSRTGIAAVAQAILRVADERHRTYREKQEDSGDKWDRRIFSHLTASWTKPGR
jgi:hypothetical protein